MPWLLQTRVIRRYRNMPSEIDWARALLFAFLGMLCLNVALFVALLGWAAVAIVTIGILTLGCLILGRLLLRSFEMMIAVEDAVEDAVAETDRLATKFEELVAELPWMEDVPQTRKMAKVLYEIKYALLSVPGRYNRNLGNNIGIEGELPSYESDVEVDVIESDDEFIESLKREIAEREAKISPNARPLQ